MHLLDRVALTADLHSAPKISKFMLNITSINLDDDFGGKTKGHHVFDDFSESIFDVLQLNIILLRISIVKVCQISPRWTKKQPHLINI